MIARYVPPSSWTPPYIVLAALLILGLGAGGAPVAHGQASLEVHAFDVEAKAPVSDVNVHLVNGGIGFESTQVTDDQGMAQWGGLSTSGAYTVFVEESDQFYEARVSGVELRANHTQSVTLLLRPVAEYELEEVVVKGRRGVAEVNRVNAEVSSSLSAASLEDLPVEGRNVTQSLYRLPNVTPSTGFFPEAPNVSINGANGLYTNYLIDGMDNNEQFLGGPQFEVPTGAVKDVTVLTSTYSAEYGRTGNGIFNVTTKSGSNQFEGEAFYLTRPGQPIDGEFTDASGNELPRRDLSGNAVQNGFQRHQGGFALGGPIVKDRTFFFANLEHTTDWKDNLLDAPGVRQTIDGQNQFTYFSGRIDHHWNDRWRSTARVNANRVRIDRQGGGLTGGVTFASAANTQQRDGVHAALQTTYAGDPLVYEGNLQYSWFNWDYADAANPNSPQVAVQDPQGTTVAVLGNPGFTFDSVENTIQLQQKLTYQLGPHTLKAGGDVLVSDHSLAGGGNPNGNYVVRLQDEAALSAFQSLDELGPGLRPGDLRSIQNQFTVENYSVELRPSTFGRRQDLVGLYVEDQFAPVPNLTVTTGLRWDYDSLTEGGGGPEEADWNNLAPRLSFNYALDGRTSLRGGYGIFYDKIVYSVVSDALQQNVSSPAYKDQIRVLIDQGILPSDTDVDEVTFSGNRSASFQDVDYLEGPTGSELSSDQIAASFSNERRILNPNGYENPQTHQFSLGVQRQFGDDLLAYVDVIHTRSYDQFRLRDLNAPEPYDISARELAINRAENLPRSRVEADKTRPVDLFQRNADGSIKFDAEGNPLYKPGVARSIVMTETEGKARYWAANVNLVKDQGDDWYSGRLSYTLSRLRNNTDDINFRAETAHQYGDEWGPSVNDRTHVISAISSVYPTDGLQVTLAGLLQSGQPINWVPDAEVFGTRDLNGDGREYGAAYVGNSDRWPGAERNSGRLPWSTRFDLSAQYAWSIGAGRVVARADIFNVLNTKNLSGFANNATQSNQIQVGPPGSDIEEKNAGPPRQFQFGLRYEF
ncbi:MAG: TonB-dependent receptor [Bacteroidetes bacterium QS_3_64_15]|nr:MAG: TonB-dependent receptor [Bacteroidetes bacterium QS_3_64_15]